MKIIRNLSLLLIVFVLISLPFHTRARQDKPAPVNQGWKIVPHIKSDDLKAELDKLNATGYAVSKDSIYKDDEGFVIVLNADDTAKGEADDDEGHRDK